GLGATLHVMALHCAGSQGSKSALPPADPFAAALLLEEAGVAEPVLRLLSRLLSPDPKARPADAREVRLELERLHPSARRTLTERLGTEVFVGRATELARIESWLASSPEGPPLLLLSAASGAGRTAL